MQFGVAVRYIFAFFEEETYYFSLHISLFPGGFTVRIQPVARIYSACVNTSTALP